MPARDGWDLVPFEPTPDQVIRIGWISAGLGFLIAIVSAVGELAGWWGLIGAIGIGVGSLLGIVATFATLSLAAGRGQVRSLHETMHGVESAVEDNNDILSTNTDILSANNELLSHNSEVLEESNAKLDRLDKLDKLDKLDVVEGELNRQTGALDRQVEILTAIRDRI